MNFNRILAAAIDDLENQEGAAERRRYSRMSPFDNLSDSQFVRSYRLGKYQTNELINILRPFMVQQTRFSALSIKTKVLAALNFYATGSYQKVIGDNIHACLSQPSVSRCVHEVTEALNQPAVFNQWVHFPANLEEINTMRQRFYNKFNMPGVIGCIDCTHVAIFPPQSNHEHIFVNRKNYHSINVQLICDPDLYVTHVNARFPGSCHDAHIWNNSNAQETLRNIYNQIGEGYFLLGDSGYPLRPWLLTPIHNPQDEYEGHFNTVHKTIRATIERCNGLLKMRFRCLSKYRALHYAPEMASKITKACVVLHNMCIRNNVALIDYDEHDIDVGNVGNIEIYEEHRQGNPDLVAGRRLRRNIAFQLL